MKIFNPNENTKIEKLQKDNAELRNTLHNVLTRYGNYEELDSKLESMEYRISELAKEELRIAEYLKSTSSQKAENSKIIFELNRDISELKKQKENLQSKSDLFTKENQEKENKQKNYELKLKELLTEIEEREKVSKDFEDNNLSLRVAALGKPPNVEEVKRELYNRRY